MSAAQTRDASQIEVVNLLATAGFQRLGSVSRERGHSPRTRYTAWVRTQGHSVAGAETLLHGQR